MDHRGRRAAAAVVVVLAAAQLSGCNQEPGPVSRERGVSILRAPGEELSASTTAFDVSVAVGGCDVDSTATVEVVEDPTGVVLRGSVETSGHHECSADLRYTERTVELADPLSDRSITDDESGAVLHPRSRRPR